MRLDDAIKTLMDYKRETGNIGVEMKVENNFYRNPELGEILDGIVFTLKIKRSELHAGHRKIDIYPGGMG